MINIAKYRPHKDSGYSDMWLVTDFTMKMIENYIASLEQRIANLERSVASMSPLSGKCEYCGDLLHERDGHFCHVLNEWL